MNTSDLSDEHIWPAWWALQGWLSRSEDGQAILEHLKADPHRAADELTEWLRVHISDPPPQLLTSVTGGQIRTIVNIAQLGALHIQRTEPLDELQQRNRHTLLDTVDHNWVKPWLDDQLHGAALIELGLKYKPDALMSSKLSPVMLPTPMKMREVTHLIQPLPATTKLLNVFNDRGGQLLILGAPGSGKTTRLADLARALISLAKQNDRHPIPVYFHLGFWEKKRQLRSAQRKNEEKRQPFAEWLVDELFLRYDVPEEIGRDWVDKDQVLPLLDGLDEVEQEYREDCVKQINAFRQEHLSRRLVVCSRIDDYEALSVKLQLQAAVVLQPLQPDQIDALLAQGGENLVAMRTALQEDPTLRELAETPLMLHIMVLAYQNPSSTALSMPAESKKARRDNLFAAYIQQTLGRQRLTTRYDPQQMILWLTWLARRMRDHSQPVFYLEYIQTTWLATAWQQRSWRVVSILLTTLLAGLASGFLFGLASQMWTSFFFFGLFAAIPMLIFAVWSARWSARLIPHSNCQFDMIRPVETLRLSGSLMRKGALGAMRKGLLLSA